MKKQNTFSFWNPVRAKPKGKVSKSSANFNFKSFNSTLKPISFFRPATTVKKKNMSWQQAAIAYPSLSPWGDVDRDGVPNMFDCRPFDRKKHIIKFRRGISRGTRKAVEGYFQQHPEERTQGERFFGKDVLWRFGDPIESRIGIPEQFRRGSTMLSARMTREEGKRPTVEISGHLPLEEYPKRIKQAMEFKKEREEKETQLALEGGGIMPKDVKQNIEQEELEEQLERASETPKLISGSKSKSNEEELITSLEES